MLELAKYSVLIQVASDVAAYNVFEELAGYACQTDWPVVLSQALGPLLEDGHYIGM